MTIERRRSTAIGAVDAAPFIEQLVGGPMTLDALIEAIRRGEEETQTEFAGRLGISKSHLCDIEKEQKLVSAEPAARFADLLGFLPEQFVRLAQQDTVRRAGLDYTVRLTHA